MGNNFLTNIIYFFRNLFKHGNFDNIDADFDLLTDKGEMSTVNPTYNQKLIDVEPPNKTIENKPLEVTITEETNSEDTNSEEPNTDNSSSESENSENSHNAYNEENSNFDFDSIDDETLRKIYETIHQINEFEKKVNKIRNIKFAKRDKNI